MTDPFDEYGERLRHALRTEADAVIPSPDGLERIRAKIDKRGEGRFATLITAPWIRPVAAAAVAVFVVILAVSATPALKTFVQSGHSSTDGGQDGGSTGIGGNHAASGPTLPETPRSPLIDSPRPGTTSRVPGTHVVTGHGCPPGEDPVGPTSPKRAMSPAPVPTLTCRPSATGSLTPTRPTKTPAGPPTQTPSPQPTPGGQPSAQISP